MQKPTSRLNFEIIEFVMRDNEVNQLLINRDKHPSAFGIEISCRFYKINASDSRFASYTVDFIYDARHPSGEIQDDISVLIQVKEGDVPEFRILGIKRY
jgi:hypothetical protein